MKIAQHKYIALNYELYAGTEDERQLVEETSIDRPLTFIYGMGMMLPDFEKELFGKEAGESFDIVLSAEQAYGEVQQEAIVSLPKDVFKNEKGEFDESVVFVGNIVPMMDSEGNKLPGEVVEITEDSVTMDFNHPLAGETLHYIGKVLEVRDATEDDINQFFSSKSCGCGCGHGDDEDHGHAGGGCCGGSCSC